MRGQDHARVLPLSPGDELGPRPGRTPGADLGRDPDPSRTPAARPALSTLPDLVLASASPRRRELLAGLGLAFSVRAAEVDETPRRAEPPADYVRRLALAKATAEARPGELVLGADTVVVVGGELLGKPRDREEAGAMLARIAGREHTVFSGLALCEPGAGGPGAGGYGACEPDAGGRSASAVESTRVMMAAMTLEEIRWYVGTGEPLDKAGAYAVQGLGTLFVEAVFGSYTNVVGLPLPATRRLFDQLGYEMLAFRRELSRRT